MIFLIIIILLIYFIIHIYFSDIDEHYTPITVEANEAIQNMASILNNNNATISNLKITGTLDAANQSQTITPKITINSGSTPKFNIFSGGNDYLHIQNGSGSDALALGQGGDAYFSGGIFGASTLSTASDITTSGQFLTKGSRAGITLQDRANANNTYTWYSSDGHAYLYNGGNIMSVDQKGNTYIAGNLQLGGGSWFPYTDGKNYIRGPAVFDTGDVSISKNLSTGGNFALGGNQQINGNVNINGTLTIGGVPITGNNGTITIGGNLSVAQNKALYLSQANGNVPYIYFGGPKKNPNLAIDNNGDPYFSQTYSANGAGVAKW